MPLTRAKLVCTTTMTLQTAPLKCERWKPAYFLSAATIHANYSRTRVKRRRTNIKLPSVYSMWIATQKWKQVLTGENLCSGQDPTIHYSSNTLCSQALWLYGDKGVNSVPTLQMSAIVYLVPVLVAHWQQCKTRCATHQQSIRHGCRHSSKRIFTRTTYGRCFFQRTPQKFHTLTRKKSNWIGIQIFIKVFLLH